MKVRITLQLIAPVIFLGVLLFFSPVFSENKEDLKADAKTNTIPIQWEQAFPKIIELPDPKKLEQGDILCEIKKEGDRTLLAQSMGLIKAKAEDCFKVVRKYNQYSQLMPRTVESKILRYFRLEGRYAGADAVDFWTKVKVFGFETGYLLRIAHLIDRSKKRFRSFWTLVENPGQISRCQDSRQNPCRNDLEMNLGSHQFEPFPENPNYTLHTYTLVLSGKSWLQQTAIHFGGRQCLEEVTNNLRTALEKKDLQKSPPQVKTLGSLTQPTP